MSKRRILGNRGSRQHVRRALPLVLVLGLFLPFFLLLLASSAQAAFPGENGKIVFHDVRSAFVAERPGGEPRRLPWRTPRFGAAWRSGTGPMVTKPEIAPDEERAVVGVSIYREYVERANFLGLLSLDGSVQTRLFDAPSGRRVDNATFSPDGSRIAFVVTRGSRGDEVSVIHLIDSDGTGLTRLIRGTDPVFSPDGGRVIFSRSGTIRSIALDGGDQRRLGTGREPDVSPNGERIVFVDRVPSNNDCSSDPEPIDPTLSIMDHDGTNVEHLRRGFICDDPSQQWSSPSFSPNGRRIVVAEWGMDGRPYAFISVMGVDGSNERFAFNPKNSISPSIGSPDWGPEATGAPSGRCAGARVTIAGTELDDRIRGTNGPDVIQARRGDDVVVGRGGRDRICGGPGDDRARGGNKADRLLGGPGDDVLRGGPGPDVLIGGKGFDRCFGGKGQDTVRCERSA